MTRLTHILLTFLLLGAVTSCDDNAWYEMPESISKFVSQYYPGQGVSEVTHPDNKYFVQIRDGATLTFDDAYQWISINGNGATLPSVLLYDQLPPQLYAQLEQLETVDSVYSISRNGRIYTVKLLDRTLTYDIDTQRSTFA